MRWNNIEMKSEMKRVWKCIKPNMQRTKSGWEVGGGGCKIKVAQNVLKHLSSNFWILMKFWKLKNFCKCLQRTNQLTGRMDTMVRAHLHLAIATPLQWRCDITPKSNVCVQSCTVTYSVCNCDITGGLLCERFKSDITVILESQPQSLSVNGL